MQHAKQVMKPPPLTPNPMAAYDDDDDDAVEAIVSQAADLCALEQIARLNTLHLSDSCLPTELESRFRKLKSFPETTARNTATPHLRRFNTHQGDTGEDSIPISAHDAKPDLSIASDDQEREQNIIMPISSPDVKNDSLMMSEEQNRHTRNGFSGFSSSPPPGQACCFGFIPGIGRRRRRREVRSDGVAGSGLDADNWGIGGGDILTELKDQERELKQLLKEQEKVNETAVKVVELVRLASARLNVTAVDDDDDELLSDHDEGFR